jgi:hypothetical protein
MVGVDPTGGPQGGGQTGGLTIPGGLGGPSRCTRRDHLNNGLPTRVERQSPRAETLRKLERSRDQEEAGVALTVDAQARATRSPSPPIRVLGEPRQIATSGGAVPGKFASRKATTRMQQTAPRQGAEFVAPGGLGTRRYPHR